MSKIQKSDFHLEGQASTIPNDLHDLAIIMCTKDRPISLFDSLSKIASNEYLSKLPIYIHDDSQWTAGENREIAERHGARIFSSHRRRGPTGGRNACMQQATAEFCLCLDDDVAPLWMQGLPAAVSRMVSNPRIAVTGFRCYRPGDGDLSPGCQVLEGPLDGFHGGACLLRRRAVLSVGGFREILFFGAEDTDLAMTLTSHGWEVYFDPSVIMEHNCDFGPRDTLQSGILYSRALVISRFAQRGGLGGIVSGVKGAVGRLHFRMRANIRKDGPQTYPIFSSFFGIMYGVCVGIFVSVRHRRALRQELPTFDDFHETDETK